MAFSTPRKLSGLATKVFVEDCILNSHLFLSFHHFRESVTKSCNPEADCNEREQVEMKLLKLKESLHEIIETADEIFRGFDETIVKKICQELRTTNHSCTSGALILQLMYDTEINFRRKHWHLLPIFMVMECSFTSIVKLFFDTTDLNSGSVFDQFIKHLPNLKVFKGALNKEDKESKCLTALRKHCSKLTHLFLYIKDGFFTCNQLTTFFFHGKQLDFVKRAYVKLETIQLSFPNLQSFSISGISFEQYDFFKMFIHFYSNALLETSLHYSQMYSHSVSWFDAVLSHSVVINPNIRIKQCDINVHDLYLPFCERTLSSWRNLQCIIINVGIQGRKNPSTNANIGKKLEYLLNRFQNVKEFCIKVQGQVSEDEVSEIILPSLTAHGGRFKELKIVSIFHHLNHRSLVQAINLCPNLQRLILIGKRIAKYFKDLKLSLLSRLQTLTVVWSEYQMSNTFCQWNSKLISDLIRNSPNLKKLLITANPFILENLCKIEFGLELCTLVVHLQTQTPTDGIDYFKKFLPKLPKLQEIVVKECETEGMLMEFLNKCNVDACRDDCIDIAYSCIKTIVNNSEVNIRYYSLEDVGSQIFV